MTSVRGTVRTSDSEIAWLSVGSGTPVTLFAHGLGSSIEETRMLVAGLPGTQVFLSFRGHAGSREDPGARWSYDAIADDLLAVADHVQATQALGISLGSAALLRLLVRAAPHRFERVVFFLPAVLHEARSDDGFSRIQDMGDLVRARDVDGLEQLLLSEMPEVVRADPRAVSYTRTRAQNLSRLRIQHLIDEIRGATPIDDLAQLRELSAPTLVITQAQDEVHPAAVGAQLAAELPSAQLEEFGVGGAMWADLPRLHAVLQEFLSA